MAILADASSRVFVQGATGREGRQRTKYMLEYGTNVVGGSSPSEAGDNVHGVPVFRNVAEATAKIGSIDISVAFVPGPQAKGAALEAIDAAIPLTVIIADRVPLYDVLDLHCAARRKGVSFLGPNTAGLICPEKSVVGMIGGSAMATRSWLRAGPAGLVSRSGGMGVSAAYAISQAGIGVSSLVHVGGDAIVGMGLDEIAVRFERDQETKVIVLIGEIGTSQEEQVGELMLAGCIKKPVIAFIGGRSAQPGMRYSHAGAIVEGNRGSYASKYEALTRAGAWIAEDLTHIPGLVRRCL